MGGRGHQRLKMSQLKMSQLGLRGGRVKSIETLSQNMQFFFSGGFPKSYLIGNCQLCLFLTHMLNQHIKCVFFRIQKLYVPLMRKVWPDSIRPADIWRRCLGMSGGTPPRGPGPECWSMRTRTCLINF